MEHVTEGIICLEQDDIEYEISKIEYHYFDDDNEQYVFIPYWNVIDLLPSDIFQGIPGLEMDLRKERYERYITPVFISERTPSENRVDLWDLLNDCGMTYLNRLEWLIRTDTRYFGDNLYVIRFEAEKSLKEANDLTKFHYGDELNISSVSSLGNKLETIIKVLLRIVASGAKLYSPELDITDSNRKEYFKLLFAINRKLYEDGRIHKRGRKKTKVSMPELDEKYRLYCAGKITRKEAMEQLHISSQSTFYRRVAEYKRMNNIDM